MISFPLLTRNLFFGFIEKPVLRHYSEQAARAGKANAKANAKAKA